MAGTVSRHVGSCGLLSVDFAHLETFLVIAGLLLLAGVVVSKISSRIGVPTLLLFMALGMLAGSEGLGGIAFDDPVVAQGVGTIALAFVLFSGGLGTRRDDVRPVAAGGALLATLGVIVTAGVTGLVAVVALGAPLQVGLLVGAIVSSTDAAAVFSVLRSRSVGLQGRLKPLLEFESGSNDPMAVLLTIAMVEWVTAGDVGGLETIRLLASQLLLGFAGGVIAAGMVVWLIRRLQLDQPGMYPIVTVAGVILFYAVIAYLGGSGFLAVYLLGLIVGNAAVPHHRRLIDFHEAAAWFMQIVLFLVLGLLVFPSRLAHVAGPAVIILLGLTFLARPLAVVLCLPRGWSWRELTLVSWVGLRGAAPILLATFPLVAGMPLGADIFDVVFVVVLLSVLVQGTTIPTVARWLGVEAPLPPPEPIAVETVREAAEDLDLIHLTIDEDAPASGKRILDLELPDRALIVLLSRGHDRAIPQGSTVLQAGDELVVLASPSDTDRIRALLRA